MLSKGFSLLEVLVAVSIVVLLTGIGFSSFNNFQRNSRDTKRQSDLRVIQSVLEQYHADLNFYPSTIDFNVPFTSSIGRTGTPAGAPRVYLKQLPKDPNNSDPTYAKYNYIALPLNCSNNCSQYSLCSKLENPPSGSNCSTNATLNFEVNQP